jgi:hypothetical protein
MARLMGRAMPCRRQSPGTTGRRQSPGTTRAPLHWSGRVIRPLGQPRRPGLRHDSTYKKDLIVLQITRTIHNSQSELTIRIQSQNSESEFKVKIRNHMSESQMSNHKSEFQSQFTSLNYNFKHKPEITSFKKSYLFQNRLPH